MGVTKQQLRSQIAALDADVTRLKFERNELRRLLAQNARRAVQRCVDFQVEVCELRVEVALIRMQRDEALEALASA